MFGDRSEGVYCIVDENGKKRYNLPEDLYDKSCFPYFKKKFVVYTDRFLLPKRAVKRSQAVGEYCDEWDAILFQWCYNTTSPFNEGFFIVHISLVKIVCKPQWAMAMRFVFAIMGHGFELRICYSGPWL